MTRPLVIAHRGYSARALENSLEAIRCALDCSVDMVEIDLRLSMDGVLHVMHDRRTGRTAGQNIDIERSTAAEISRLRLKNGEPVPTLADVLTLVAGRVALDLELKSPGAGAMTAAQLRASGYRGEMLLSSFDGEELAAVRRLAPELPTAVICKSFAPREVSGYRREGYRVLCLEKGAVKAELVDACRDEGVRLYVWTVDEEEEMERFVALGVDGICTNRPGDLREVIRRMTGVQCPS